MSEESPRNYLTAVESRLATDGCKPEWQDWSGVRVLVGRRSDFKLRWAATNLHVFTIAAAVPEISVGTIDTFTSQALGFAKKNKGGLPVGMQTGVAVFPVLISERVDPAAVAWAEEKQRNQFACFARPVVVDTARHYVGLFRGKPVLGRIYASHLTGKGQRYFDHPA
ncbi:levansucrase [Streptomyces sp. H39-S7]|uniref:levansucrase n=1 Tax=Streptomyces sp. H39-S7 TaxID=3004357 RepID=UPI0022AEB17F|nr:levansucrase [Streptomyces sp. H39-S7]MCZ4124807.1 levansucrase [Streptomyces sp. H39-S7]